MLPCSVFTHNVLIFCYLQCLTHKNILRLYWIVFSHLSYITNITTIWTWQTSQTLHRNMTIITYMTKIITLQSVETWEAKYYNQCTHYKGYICISNIRNCLDSTNRTNIISFTNIKNITSTTKWQKVLT